MSFNMTANTVMLTIDPMILSGIIKVEATITRCSMTMKETLNLACYVSEFV